MLGCMNNPAPTSPGTSPALILGLGIFAFVILQFLGPIVWYMASKRLKTMGPDEHQRGFVVVGRILGIVATALFVLSIVMLFLGFVPGI